MSRLKSLLRLLTDTVGAFLADRATIYAAGLAYYAVFSLAPLMVFVIVIAGYFIGRSSASEQIALQLGFIFGPQLGAFVDELVVAVNAQVNTGTLTLLSIGGLILGASGIFNQLRNSLNIIWGIVVDRPTDLRGYLALARSRAIPFLMVFVMGLLFSLSVMLDTVLGVVESRLAPFFPQLAALLPLAGRVFIPALTLTTFTLIYRILPDARARWREALLGAALATALFLIGRFFLAFFLGRSNTGSVFGTAGSLIVLLVWIYFSANLLLLGAEFIKLYSARYGRPIRPSRLGRFEGDPVVQELPVNSRGLGPDERVA